MDLNYKSLKNRHREVRKSQPETTRLRIHRALSWLNASEEAEHHDEKFIFLWISFNSIYAQENGMDLSFSEKGLFKQFLGQLVRLDSQDLIHNIAWENYADKIRLFIDNQYAYQPYWDFRNGLITDEVWLRKYSSSKKTAHAALAKKDATVFCNTLFDRLYVLRNQLMHGGATWGGATNRAQVRDGARILEQFVPAMIHIMMENADELWGSPYYMPEDNS